MQRPAKNAKKLCSLTKARLCSLGWSVRTRWCTCARCWGPRPRAWIPPRPCSRCCSSCATPPHVSRQRPPWPTSGMLSIRLQHVPVHSPLTPRPLQQPPPGRLSNQLVACNHYRRRGSPAPRLETPLQRSRLGRECTIVNRSKGKDRVRGRQSEWSVVLDSADSLGEVYIYMENVHISMCKCVFVRGCRRVRVYVSARLFFFPLLGVWAANQQLGKSHYCTAADKGCQVLQKL